MTILDELQWRELLADCTDKPALLERCQKGPLTLYCGHGERAMTAASLLERAGRDDLFVMLGGPSDWSAATGRALA